MDAYFRSNPSLIVTTDKDAISTKRPAKYIEHENEEIQKNKKGVTKEGVPAPAGLEVREIEG